MFSRGAGYTAQRRTYDVGHIVAFLYLISVCFVFCSSFFFGQASDRASVELGCRNSTLLYLCVRSGSSWKEGCREGWM